MSYQFIVDFLPIEISSLRGVLDSCLRKDSTESNLELGSEPEKFQEAARSTRFRNVLDRYCSIAV